MITTAPEKWLTTSDFAAHLAADPALSARALELINGRMIEKHVPNPEHSALAAQIAFMIKQHLQQEKIGFVLVEADVVLPGDARNWRRPDVAFIHREQGEFDWKAALPFMPHLVIEIKSPSDSYTLMRQKALYYIERGARLVWLIFPERRAAEVYTHDEQIITVAEDAALSGGDVLPGLSLSLREVFSYAS